MENVLVFTGWVGISRKARIIEVVYNGANNEFVRTNTLVRGEVVLIDATPFRLWWESYYGVPIKRTKKVAAAGTKAAPAKGKKVFTTITTPLHYVLHRLFYICTTNISKLRR